MSHEREILHSTVSVEWYTPKNITNLVREVFQKEIDLDPASCEEANRLVCANAYYTKEDNGLTKSWDAENVFLNPPYGRNGQRDWTRKFLAEFAQKHFQEGIILTNAAVGATWFQPLWEHKICFPKGRIKFVSTEEKHHPTHYNAFTYVGPNSERFKEVFSSIGVVR